MAKKRISHNDLVAPYSLDGSDNGSENQNLTDEQTDSSEPETSNDESEPETSNEVSESEDTDKSSDNVEEGNTTTISETKPEENKKNSEEQNNSKSTTALSVKPEAEVIYPEKGKPQTRGFTVYLDEETYNFMKKFAKAEYGSDSKYAAFLIKKDIDENRAKHVETIKENLIRRRAELEALDRELSEL